MLKHIHFIGIGGIGMSAIAQLFLNKETFTISGCDLKENELIINLRQRGVQIFSGHAAQHLSGVDTVVYSSAISEDNPEIREVRRLGIRLMKRAEALNFLMQDETVITVSGMHGKTTVASLAAHVLSQAGLLPTVAVGGIIENLGVNALSGEGKFFVAEADESDGSFLYYHPDYSIITNIDYEHLDYYRDFDSIREAFKCFINQTRDNGCVFAWRDDPYLSKLLKSYKGKVILYGLGQGAGLSASNITMRGLTAEFDCLKDDVLIGHFKLALGGKHNVLNALSVIALSLQLNIDAEVISSSLVSYRGSRRRLETKFKSNNYLVLDDYGHHPTEIKATLEAVRLLNPGRLIVAFQPHRYTRTKLLLDSFVTCFDLADYVIITDVYAAGEPALKGVSGRSIHERLKPGRQLKEFKFLEKDKISRHILEILKPQDVVLILGAGDITKLSDELAESLKGKN